MLRQFVKYSSRLYNISRSKASRTLSQFNTRKKITRISQPNTSARKFWSASIAKYSTENTPNKNKILEEEEIPEAEWDVPPGKIN